jgi:DNA-binding MarR family transcriptional regulator
LIYCLIAMNPQDIARDAIRLVTTAGLGKDVIDLLEKKVALLTDQIAALEQKNFVLETDDAELKRKVISLQQELENLRPKQDELEEGAKKFLQLLFNAGDSLTLEQIAANLGLPKSMADYHADALVAIGMIEVSAITPAGAMLMLTAKGRAYVVKNKLA